MINFKLLNPYDDDFYSLYCQAYSWDKEHLCFSQKELPEFLGLFKRTFGLYENDIFIGYGILNLKISLDPNIRIRVEGIKPSKKEENIQSEPSKVELAYIIHPKYRQLGYGSKLVQYLLEKIGEMKEIDLVEVEIWKRNKASISLIEKFNFEFQQFDEEKIVFQKRLKK